MRTEPLAQRLLHELTARLAVQANCCPHHGGRLICPFCDVVSTASASEDAEMEGLLERTALYDLACPSWPCGRCGAEAMCLDCYEPFSDQAFVGLTPGEQARCAELLARTMRYTFLPEPSDKDRGRESHEGGEIP
jgi:hypothetical protein